mmetsp:Transcript_42137/g.68411  ORF Transcript_42137/g.68411 Transcript_42137/m.68411 type:complete len:1142 (-) Transcript_42137:119-3544(-)
MAKESAEHLLILREACYGLLCRVHWNHNPQFLNPTSLESKDISQVIRFAKRSFPKISCLEARQQIKTFDAFVSKAEAIVNELEDWYRTICDVISFNGKALTALNTFVKNVTTLRKANFHLMMLFFELLGGYVKLQIAMQSVGFKARNIAMYIMALETSQSKKDERLDAVLKYMSEMMGNQDLKLEERLKVTFATLRQQCEPMTQVVRDSCKFFWSSIQKWAPAESFERHRMFSILYDASKIIQPARTENYLELEYLNGVREWLQYALLVCPAALQEQAARSCLNKIISNYFVTPVFRDITFELCKSWDSTFWDYKCGHISQGTKFYLKTHRDDVFKDAYLKGNECALNHRSLRRYLQVMLRQYVCLFTEIPGLAAPKFQLVLALLKLASDEIHWYFQHTNVKPFKSHKQKWLDPLSKDQNIVKLIAACVDLCQLVSKHADVVREYFIEYIRDIDAPRCISELGKISQKYAKQVPAEVQNAIRVLTEEAKNISPESKFSVIQLNFFRTSCWLSSRGSGVPADEANAALAVVNEMFTHFSNVLQTEQRLVETANIGALIWYKEDFKQVKEWTLGRSDLYQYSMALMQVLEHVRYDLNLRYCPDEQAFIIRATTKFAEFVMEHICRAIIENFDKMLGWANYLKELGGLNPVINKYLSLNRKGRPKLQETAQPGVESRYGGQGYYSVQVQAQAVADLLGAVRELRQCQVFKTVINTHDWLYEALDVHVDAKIRGLFESKDQRLCRPSEALSRLRCIQRALTFVEQHIMLNASDILRGAVLKHFANVAAGTIGAPLKTDTKSSAAIQKVGKFYWDVVNHSNTAFSPLKIHFVTRAHGRRHRDDVNAEDFTTHPELRALCHVVGPYGVKAIQSVLLSNLGSSIAEMKRIIANNSVYLGQLDFVDITSWENIVTKVSGKDEFLRLAVQVGRCLQLISTLKTAQRAVQENDIPFVSRIIELVMRRIDKDGKITPGQTLCNVLTDSGVEDPMYDQGLKAVFQRGFSSGVVLSHFPKMFACLFMSEMWKSTRFQPEAEAFSTGVESVITTIQTVIPAICSSREKSMGMLRDFVTLSAHALLHMNSKAEANSRAMRGYHIPSMMIFMSQFMETCKGMSMDILERCLPFTLMRTKIIEIYENLRVQTEEKGAA